MAKATKAFENTRSLSALVRAGEAQAIAHVVKAVHDAFGSMRGAAEALGVAERTLWDWRAASKPLDRALKGVALGRAANMKRVGKARTEENRR